MLRACRVVKGHKRCGVCHSEEAVVEFQINWIHALEELASHIDDGVSESDLQVGYEGWDGNHRGRSEGVIPGPELDAIIGLITRY